MRRLYDGYILGSTGGLPLQKNRVYPNNCRIEPRTKTRGGQRILFEHDDPAYAGTGARCYKKHKS